MLQWFYKYKIYHLLFWLLYHFAWWSLASGSVVEAAHNILYSPYSTKFVFYVVLQAFGVYFSLYFLMPRFLYKGRYIVFALLVVATIMVTAALIISGYYVTAFLSGSSFEGLFGDATFLGLFVSNSFPSTVASMTLAMSIKLGKNYIQAQKRQQVLEKEKIETELKFLKSQFNPHFMFNTINSIFVLIHKNQDMASESLAKFSDLLRYQLYECNEKEIEIDKEIRYLSNFIELSRLRLDDSVNVEVVMEISDHPGIKIAPFILMPFVENAFKHVSQTTGANNWLKIALKQEDAHLIFRISNTYRPETNTVVKGVYESSGIGLKNVKRRLELLYPNSYALKVKETKGTYSAELKLQLALPEVSHKTQEIESPVFQT